MSSIEIPPLFLYMHVQGKRVKKIRVDENGELKFIIDYEYLSDEKDYWTGMRKKKREEREYDASYLCFCQEDNDE